MWFAELLQRRASETPGAVAYRFLERDLREAALLSYAELERQVSALALGLSAATRPGAHVVLALPSGVDFVLALLACLVAGRVAVPAPVAQRRDDAALGRLRGIVADAEPELVIVPQAEHAADALGKQTRQCTLAELRAAGGASNASGHAGPLALLQYTSGAIAEPKGVAISHAALRANLEQIARHIGGPGETGCVSWLPMHHDMGLVGCVLAALQAGLPLTWFAPLDFVQRPARWLRAISRYGASVSLAPPFAYRMCVERVRDDQLLDVDLSGWSSALLGAERISENMLRAFARRFAAHGFRADAFLPCYGLAEATLMVSCPRRAPRRLHIAAPEPEPSRAASASCVGCGSVIDGHELWVVDPVSRRRRGDGVVGEIWVRGASLGDGYWRRPEQSVETFQAYSAGQGPFLRTGDLGFVRDGQLFVTGRLKETINVRGRKFAPEDLERSVSESHPALAHMPGAAFAELFEGAETFVIVQELRAQRPSLAELLSIHATAIERLIREHGVGPHELTLVKPGSIPRTTSGKLQRQRCRELWRQGTLERCRIAPPRESAAQPPQHR